MSSGMGTALYVLWYIEFCTNVSLKAAVVSDSNNCKYNCVPVNTVLCRRIVLEI